MYLKGETEKLATDLTQSVRTWAESKIDELCATRPRLKAASVYLKRGLNNWLDREESKVGEMVDTLALFAADKDGNIDADTLIEDAVNIFREMDMNYTEMGAFAVEYGKGAVTIHIPHNLFLDMIFGDLGQVKITADDLLELKALMAT